MPKAWTPLETTTTEEAVFLAPLDHVSARGRAKILFGFDYVWEVYKPEHLRKFGYYTLPILWGDRLVARFDSKLDRTTNTFVILGLWLEDEALGKDEAFAEALRLAMTRSGDFLDAKRVDGTAIRQPLLRRALAVASPGRICGTVTPAMPCRQCAPALPRIGWTSLAELPQPPSEGQVGDPEHDRPEAHQPGQRQGGQPRRPVSWIGRAVAGRPVGVGSRRRAPNARTVAGRRPSVPDSVLRRCVSRIHGPSWTKWNLR